jgi:hypothetical protein
MRKRKSSECQLLPSCARTALNTQNAIGKSVLLVLLELGLGLSRCALLVSLTLYAHPMCGRFCA